MIRHIRGTIVVGRVVKVVVSSLVIRNRHRLDAGNATRRDRAESHTNGQDCLAPEGLAGFHTGDVVTGQGQRPWLDRLKYEERSAHADH